MLTIGELFAGYGGLGMGVAAALGGEVRWVSDIDKGPSKVLAHRFPDAPNHGDITKIKWTPDCPKCGELLALYWNNDMPEGRGYYCPADGWFDLDLWRSEPGVPEPVEILTGGSPCQDLSTAGKRAGMTDGTRSNLWVAMREAIAQLRPGLVVWENVRGALSASADSAVEPCAGCVGDGSGHVLRALGRVLGDLSELGYDAAWCGLRAADVGAAHGRFRVFVLAWDATADADGLGLERAGGTRGRGDGSTDDRGPDVRVLPTPTTRDHKDHTIRREPHRPDDTDTLASALTDVPCALLPTPAVNDMGEGKTVEKWDSWTDAMKAKHGNGNGHGKSLSIEAQRLLPTLRTQNNENRQSAGYGGDDGNFYGLMQNPERWGDYAAAIQRWEHVIGRPAPEPTQTSAKGNPQLSARFAEWLMGVPEGWITDVPGVTRNEALKACGNGVVPQQCAAAIRWLWQYVPASVRADLLGVAA